MQFRPVKEQLEILMRGVTDIVPQDELEKKLQKSYETGKPLRIKMGVDPTAPDVHFGHTVVMRKLRQFQDLGHTVVLIVGDYTAQIGDPSGRNKARPRLTHEQVLENAKEYQEQFFKVVRRDQVEIHYNGEWFSKNGSPSSRSARSPNSWASSLSPRCSNAKTSTTAMPPIRRSASTNSCTR